MWTSARARIGACTLANMTVDDLVRADDAPTLPVLADALERVSPAAVLSHRSAAQVWGLWIPGFEGIEVTTPATERGSRYTTGVQRRSIVAHRRILSAEDLTTRYGLPVTSLARTWLDLAPFLDVHDLVAAGDSALRLGASKQDLAERARCAFRTRGAIRARQAAPLLNGRSKSRPESRIRAGIVLGGLPEPRVNEAVQDRHGGWLAEPDLHYDEARLAIEFNGAVHADVKRQPQGLHPHPRPATRGLARARLHDAPRIRSASRGCARRLRQSLAPCPGLPGRTPDADAPLAMSDVRPRSETNNSASLMCAGRLSTSRPHRPGPVPVRGRARRRRSAGHRRAGR